MLERITIMAGGTGGHVFPGLAIAEAFRERGVEVAWLGTEGGMEADWVRRAGIPFEAIAIRGLRGKGAVGWLKAPWNVARATAQARRILQRQRAQGMLSMGGFVCGPGGLAARSLGLPLFIHEQNAIPGLTNRLLAPFAEGVFAAFPLQKYSLGKRVQVVGNPVRREIAAVPPLAPHRPCHLLVVGGSRGALALNEAVPAALAQLPAARRPEVWHQTGTATHAQALAAYARHGIAARIDPFIDNMAEAYAWADLVVSRSGALTVSELMAAGRPAIMVPFPHAVDDHQRANAAVIEAIGGGACIVQQQLTPALLAERLQTWCKPERLQGAADALRAHAHTDAAQRIVASIMERYAG